MAKRGNIATVLTIEGDASGAIKSIKALTDNLAQLRRKFQTNLASFGSGLSKLIQNDQRPFDWHRRAISRVQNEQLAAFQRSAKYLETQRQQLEQQLALQRAIARESTRSSRERAEAFRAAERIKQHLAVLGNSRQIFTREFVSFVDSFRSGRAYGGRISRPEDLPVRHRTRAEMLSEGLRNYYGNFQRVLPGATKNITRGSMMTATAMGAVYSANYAVKSLSSFVEPGSETAQLIKNIAAVTGQDLPSLNREIKKLGATTPYTTKQVASAAYSMAKAGYSAQNIKTALAGSIYMGLATDSDPTAAADVTAQTLSHFGLKSNMSSRVGNLYAKAMVTSPASLSELAYTMQYAGPSALLTQTDFSTTLSMAGLLAKNGIRGSKAGTGLRSVFTRLASPGKAANESLAALGVQVKDLKGNLRSVPDIFEDLNTSMKKLSTTQKTAHLKNIFGQVAMGAASILMEKSGKGNNELKRYITELRRGDQENAAARIAAMKQDTYQGDLQKLSSAFEGLQIAVFDAIEGKLRMCVQHMTELLNKTTAWINENHAAISLYWDIGVQVSKIAGAFIIAQTAAGIISSLVGAMQISMAAVSGLAGGLAAASIATNLAFGGTLAAIVLIYYYWDDIMKKTTEWTDKLSKLGLFNKLEPTMNVLRNKYSYGQASAKERKEADMDAAASYWLNKNYGSQQDTAKNRALVKAWANPKSNIFDLTSIGSSPFVTAEIYKNSREGLRKELEAITATQQKQIIKQTGGLKNASEFVASENINYRRKKFYNNLSTRAEKEGYQSVGAMWLRDNIEQAKMQRSAIGGKDLQKLYQQQQQSMEDMQKLAANFSPALASTGGPATLASAPIQNATAAKTASVPTVSPELLQTLTAAQKPNQNTVNVAGTSVSVSVHCDASSIQAFVDEVMRAAKPRIEAMVSSQVEKVKGALNSVAQKKTAGASML